MNILFAMCEDYLDSIFFMQMFGKVLSTIYATMLASCTSKAKHQICKTAFHITLDMCICQFVYTLKKFEYLAIILQESNHFGI